LKKVPAAETVHHDFVGGLLEHTYEMLLMAKKCK
ncbi:TraI domain-containing protein, partial [Patescibacteria group bacterium]|nr:TraI domain-containing protein [Patescibacteria group bacterium]